MIEAGVYHLTIKRGEPFSFQFKITNDGTVLDLTNLNVVSEVRIQKDTTSTEIVSFTCKVDGAAVPNATPTNNIIELSLSAVQTAAITQNAGYYDVLIDDATYYLEGSVCIEPSERVTEIP